MKGGLTVNKQKLIKKYDKQVKMYTDSNKNQKLDGLRRRLMSKAFGKVLEVGIGTGQNFAYYSTTVELTGVDFSSEMLKIARKNATSHHVNAKFIEKDIDSLQVESNSFDCIVSTLSLCSYPDPVATLNQFNDWCNADGKILLMEHGLSSKQLLSFMQKVFNPVYYKFAGCHANRDFTDIMNKSKLHVENVTRYFSGVVYVIEAKPVK